MRKRIIILCDGTWNIRNAANQTHVARLADMIPDKDPGGVEQKARYMPGVGTGLGASKMPKALDKWIGGSMGYGLSKNVAAAYEQLVLDYEAGDEVYVFGFSRGAFTARSLIGLIRSVGILPRDRLNEIPRLQKYYRSGDPDSHPRNPASFRKRLLFSPDFSTSKAEQKWRQTHGYGDSHVVELDYLGVWDTVGALGIPAHLNAVAWVTKWLYQFHDTNLSSIVKGGRHAVSVDENRKSYIPTLWHNLPYLNGALQTDQSPYQEKWFAGNHGTVGGSRADLGLAAITFNWVLKGARDRGLYLDPEKYAAVVTEQDAMGPLADPGTKRGLFSSLSSRAPRPGPPGFGFVSPSVKVRWALSRRPDHSGEVYDPAPLRPLTLDFEDWDNRLGD